MGVREIAATRIAELGLKQSVLAARHGVSEKWLSNRLVGTTAIKADEVPIFAAMAELPCAAFFPDCTAAGQETFTEDGTFGGWQRPPQSPIPSEDLTFQDILASDLFGPAERDALAEVAGALLRFRRRVAGNRASGE